MTTAHMLKYFSSYHYSALYQSCIYSQKCSWRWATLSPKTCRADSNRSINENYCILMVAYILLLLPYFPVWVWVC